MRVFQERGRIVHEVQVAEGIGDLRAKVGLITCVWCEVSQRSRLPPVTCGCAGRSWPDSRCGRGRR